MHKDTENSFIDLVVEWSLDPSENDHKKHQKEYKDIAEWICKSVIENNHSDITIEEALDLAKNNPQELIDYTNAILWQKSKRLGIDDAFPNAENPYDPISARVGYYVCRYFYKAANLEFLNEISSMPMFF